MLDFRVETFLAVCRHMNFTKAARELNITPPAVSHHMHYLEQAYGTALFQHNGKRLQLTEAGEILRRTLMTMKHDEQHLQKRMQQVVSGTRDYSFGATLSVAEFMINEALGRFLRLHPDSHIQMQVADTKVLLSKLDSGELDFAVVEGDFPKAEYDFFVFGTEEYVAAGDPATMESAVYFHVLKLNTAGYTPSSHIPNLRRTAHRHYRHHSSDPVPIRALPSPTESLCRCH